MLDGKLWAIAIVATLASCNGWLGEARSVDGSGADADGVDGYQMGHCSDLERAVQSNPDNEEFRVSFEEGCGGKGEGQPNGIIIITDADGNVIFVAVLDKDCSGGGRVIFMDGSVMHFDDLACALARKLTGAGLWEGVCAIPPPYSGSQSTVSTTTSVSECYECIATEITAALAGQGYAADRDCQLSEAFQIQLANMEVLGEEELAANAWDLAAQVTSKLSGSCDIPCPVEIEEYVAAMTSGEWNGDDLLYSVECAQFCTGSVSCGAESGGSGSCGSVYYVRDQGVGSSWNLSTDFSPDAEQELPPSEQREYQATSCVNSRVGDTSSPDSGSGSDSPTTGFKLRTVRGGDTNLDTSGYDPKIYLCCPGSLDGYDSSGDELCAQLAGS